MTRSDQIAALGPYVRDLADRILLKDWTIILPDQVADQDNKAEIYVVAGQHHATIYLGYDFFEKDPEERRLILCHELIHCHFDRAARVAEGEMKKSRKRDFRMMVEYGVDDMARVIAPTMPMPPDSSRKRDEKGKKS